MIRLRAILATHDAEVVDVFAVAEDAHAAVAAFGGIAAHAIDALLSGVANAGDIQKMLAFQLRVERLAEEEAQGILRALSWRVAIAKIDLVADAQDVAQANAAPACARASSSADLEVIRRLAGHRKACLPGNLGA